MLTHMHVHACTCMRMLSCSWLLESSHINLLHCVDVCQVKSFPNSKTPSLTLTHTHTHLRHHMCHHCTCSYMHVQVQLHACTGAATCMYRCSYMNVQVQLHACTGAATCTCIVTCMYMCQGWSKWSDSTCRSGY